MQTAVRECILHLGKATPEIRAINWSSYASSSGCHRCGSRRVTGLYVQHCHASPSPSMRPVEQLAQDPKSDSSRRLFQKVLDGGHKPPQDMAPPPQQPPSQFRRVMGWVGNIAFYGSLAAAAGFAASRYVYTLEDAREMAKQAEESDKVHGTLLTQIQASVLGGYRSAREWCEEKVVEFTEPPSQVLLPDLHPIHAAHRLRTLVLDVDDVLIRSTWNRGVGWKTFKRPGASDFLEVLCRQYELVTFSNRSHSYVDPILNRVDPGIQRGEGPVIAYRLYKNANSIRDNEHVRDLSKLNRDLSRTLFIVGESRAHTVLQQENVLVIPDWEDMDPNDRTLLDILPLLDILYKQDVLDVRKVCESYKGKDVVSEFRKRMTEADTKATQQSQASRLRFGLN